MAILLDILVACPRCQGEGKWTKEQTEGDPIVIDPCEFCNGEKYLPTYKLDMTTFAKKLNDKLDEILDKLE